MATLTVIGATYALASQASISATSALADAGTALTTAQSAQTTADSANTSAQTAQATAESAQTTAESAYSPTNPPPPGSSASIGGVFAWDDPPGVGDGGWGDVLDAGNIAIFTSDTAHTVSDAFFDDPQDGRVWRLGNGNPTTDLTNILTFSDSNPTAFLTLSPGEYVRLTRFGGAWYPIAGT